MKRHKFIQNKFKGAGAAGAVSLRYAGLEAVFSVPDEIKIAGLFPLNESSIDQSIFRAAEKEVAQL